MGSLPNAESTASNDGDPAGKVMDLLLGTDHGV